MWNENFSNLRCAGDVFLFMKLAHKLQLCMNDLNRTLRNEIILNMKNSKVLLNNRAQIEQNQVHGELFNLVKRLVLYMKFLTYCPEKICLF